MKKYMLKLLFSLTFSHVSYIFFPFYFSLLFFICVWFTLVGVIGGGTYYKEFDEFTVENWILFPVGCLISFCGIYLLSMKPGSVFGGKKENIDLAHKNSATEFNKYDERARQSRNFRTSVHVPFLSKNDSNSFTVKKSRNRVVKTLRWSLTADDLKIVSKSLRGI